MNSIKSLIFDSTKILLPKRLVLAYSLIAKATITRLDLSLRFFCIDATLLCEFESDKI